MELLEAGHDKSLPDAVGAVIKRTADRIVKEGLDIPDGLALFNLMK